MGLVLCAYLCPQHPVGEIGADLDHTRYGIEEIRVAAGPQMIARFFPGHETRAGFRIESVVRRQLVIFGKILDHQFENSSAVEGIAADKGKLISRLGIARPVIGR